VEKMSIFESLILTFMSGFETAI